MPGILSKNPLRTSRPLTAPDLDGVDPAAFADTAEEALPLGYAFGSTDPAAMVAALWTTEDIAGSYDPVTQTWVGPDGADMTEALKGRCLTYVPMTGKDWANDAMTDYS